MTTVDHVCPWPRLACFERVGGCGIRLLPPHALAWICMQSACALSVTGLCPLHLVLWAVVVVAEVRSLFVGMQQHWSTLCLSTLLHVHVCACVPASRADTTAAAVFASCGGPSAHKHQQQQSAAALPKAQGLLSRVCRVVWCGLCKGLDAVKYHKLHSEPGGSYTCAHHVGQRCCATCGTLQPHFCS